MEDETVRLAAFHDELGDGDGQELHIQMEGEIHRIGASGMGRDQRADLRLQGVGEAGNRHAAQVGVMGDGRSRSSGVGDHGEPVATQPRLGGVDPAVGVKVFDGMATDDSGLPEDAFIENVGAGQGAGVAEARPGAGRRSAHVLGEDRFQRRDPPRGFDEPPAVADPFDV